MRCYDCERDLERDEARFAFGEYYCENCFDEVFTYCSHCDETIYRSEAHYDDDGDALCNSCYERDFDDDSPNNPEVYDKDRKLILNLSRNWITGRYPCSSFIQINKNDSELARLRSAVGLVLNPVYIYGLMDRDEYNITASSDIREELTTLLNSRGYYLQIQETSSARRIGLSLSLRQNHFHLLVEILKQITMSDSEVERSENLCVA